MDHTLKAVDADLGGMTHGIAAMGDLAVSQVRASLDAFLSHDLDLAAKVVRGDDAPSACIRNRMLSASRSRPRLIS